MSGVIKKEIQVCDKKLDGFPNFPIAISPAGDLLLVGSIQGQWNQESKTFGFSIPSRILRVSYGKQMAVRDKYTMRRAVWDPKGRYVAFTDGGNSFFILQHPVGGSSGSMEITFPSSITYLAVTSDGNSLAAGQDEAITVFDIQ
jgi:hypothetical protein